MALFQFLSIFWRLQGEFPFSTRKTNAFFINLLSFHIFCSKEPNSIGLFLSFSSHKLQFEAVWALTNITAGTSFQTHKVVKAGAIPKLVNLLKSPHVNVAEQSVWALGNMAGDGSHTRDKILSHNTAEVLLEILQTDQPVILCYFI